MSVIGKFWRSFDFERREEKSTYERLFAEKAQVKTVDLHPRVYAAVYSAQTRNDTTSIQEESAGTGKV